MATSETSNKDASADVSDIKRKLAWRMGFAGLMIVALLGGLALFDYMGEQGVTESSAPPPTGSGCQKSDYPAGNAGRNCA